MADLQIEDELATTLSELAAHENLSVEAFLHVLIERYHHEQPSDLSTASTAGDGWRADDLDKFIGMFDDDIHDLSASVHESVTDAIRRKHARPS